MEFIHYLSKIIIKFLLHIFWIFPVKKTRFTLLNRLSFTYGDNLKYLCKALYDKYASEIQIVFPLKDTEPMPPLPITRVKPFSFRYFKMILSSSVVITNGVGISYLPLRKSQIVINTWHGGGPYKKTGLAVYNSYWMKRENILNDKVTTYMLSSCEYFSKYEAPGLGISAKKCICSGMPRNDIFFHENTDIKQKVRNTYNIKQNEKIVIYAPTYRGNEWIGSKKFSTDIDYKEILLSLKQKFCGEWRFAVRLHPGLKDVELQDDDIINFTSYPDMQELLYTADVVISDYSSLIWDFSFTKRPCFLYAPDIEQYEKERGFYMPSKQWPFPISKTNEELVIAIGMFDFNKYQQNVMKHHIESGSFERGTACETVLKIIEKHINKE